MIFNQTLLCHLTPEHGIIVDIITPESTGVKGFNVPAWLYISLNITIDIFIRD